MAKKFGDIVAKVVISRNCTEIHIVANNQYTNITMAKIDLNEVRMAYESPRTSHLTVAMSAMIAASKVKQDEEVAEQKIPDLTFEDHGWEEEHYTTTP